MKRILLFCMLYGVSIFAYADYCPANSIDTSFYKAFWKNDGSGKSRVSCIYKYIHGAPTDEVIKTPREYDEVAITRHPEWHGDSVNGYTCFNQNQYNCSFG